MAVAADIRRADSFMTDRAIATDVVQRGRVVQFGNCQRSGSVAGFAVRPVQSDIGMTEVAAIRRILGAVCVVFAGRMTGRANDPPGFRADVTGRAKARLVSRCRMMSGSNLLAITGMTSAAISFSDGCPGMTRGALVG